MGCVGGSGDQKNGSIVLDEASKTFFKEAFKGKKLKFVIATNAKKEILAMRVYKKGPVAAFITTLKKDLKGDPDSSGSSQFCFGVISGQGKDLNFQISRADNFKRAPAKTKTLKGFIKKETGLETSPIFEIVDKTPLVIDPDDPVAKEFLDLKEDVFVICDAYPKLAREINSLCMIIGKMLDNGDNKAAAEKIKELKQFIDDAASKDGDAKRDNKDRFQRDFRKVEERSKSYLKEKKGDASRIRAMMSMIAETGDEKKDYDKALKIIDKLNEELDKAQPESGETPVLKKFGVQAKKADLLRERLLRISNTESKKLADEMDLKLTQIKDLVDKGDNEEALRLLEEFTSYLKDLEVKIKDLEVKTFENDSKKVFSLANDLLKGGMGDSKWINQKIVDITKLGKSEAYSAALKELTLFEEELQAIKEIFLNVDTQIKKLEELSQKLSDKVALKTSDKAITESEEMVKKFKKVKDKMASSRIKLLNDKVTIVKESITQINKAEILLSKCPKLIADTINKQLGTIRSLIKKNNRESLQTALVEFAKYLLDAGDIKKAKKYENDVEKVFALAKDLSGKKEIDSTSINKKAASIEELAKSGYYTKALKDLETFEKELQAIQKISSEGPGCIKNLQALTDKSSLKEIENVIKESENVVKQKTATKEKKALYLFQILEGEINSVKKGILTKKTREYETKVKTDILKYVLEDKTKDFHAFADAFGGEAGLKKLYKTFGGDRGLFAIKKIYDSICRKDPKKMAELVKALA